MNVLGVTRSQSFAWLQKCVKNSFVFKSNTTRNFCDDTPRMISEKCVNQVTLLGRVGINPQLRGTESKPVVVFTVATNSYFKYDSGQMQQKTDWHKISIFKPHLRDIVMEYLQKGQRIYIEGKISYGEFADEKGVMHNTTSIVANEIIFVGGEKKKTQEDDSEDVETSVL